MPSQTLNYTGASETADVSDRDLILLRMWGAGGGENSNTASSGLGGYTEALVDVSDIDALDVYVAGGGGDTWGYYNGGEGGASATGGGYDGANGAGATAVLVNNSPIAFADGGGGGGGNATSSYGGGGGGGGARGGAGGWSTFEHGDDGEGTGFGGDGGDGGDYGEDGLPGGDGGGEIVDGTHTSNETTQTGGGNDGHAVVEIAWLEQPTGVAVTDVRETEADLSWDAVTDADGYDVYRHDAPDPADNGERVVSNHSTTSYTDTGLENGTTYYYQIVARNSDGAESPASATVTGTSVLPATGIDAVESVSANELRITWTKADNNTSGDWRLYRSDTDSATGDLIEVLSVTADEYIDSGLAPGERYYYTLRRDTGDATADSGQVFGTTGVLPPANLGATTIAFQEVTLEWESETDSEDEFVVERQRKWRDGWGERMELATLDATARSYTNDTLHPSRQYRFWVRAVGEYNTEESSLEVETADAGLEQSPAPARGWHVEVDHPSGQTLTPQVLDDLERRPRLNEQSLIEISIPRNERWLSEEFEDVEVRAWKDGTRLPVDRLAEEPVEITPEHVLLRATGGEQLRKRVEADVDVEAIDDLVRRLVEENTDYTASVDEPAASVQETEMQAVTTDADWTSVTQETDLSRLPFEIADGRLETLDACDPRDALGGSDGEDVEFVNGDEYNNGQAALFGTGGQHLEFTITFPYTIPGDAVGIQVRQAAENNGVEMSYRWDGEEFASHSATDFGLQWGDIGASSLRYGDGYRDAIGADIQAGETYTFSIVSSGSNGGAIADAVAVYDQRYEETFDFPNPDATENGGGYLDGPQPKPIAPLALDRAETIFAVLDGTLEADFDDITDGQKLGLRNQTGVDFTRESNTGSITVNFADSGAFVQAELTLGRYGERDAFPRTGFESQTVSSYTLSATLDDTPLVIDQRFNDDLGTILARLAEDTNSIWEVTWDDTAGTMAIEWTQPGQRPSDQDLDIVNYTTRKVVPGIKRAEVEGSGQPVRDEAFTANVGEAVELDGLPGVGNSVLVPGTDRVFTGDGTVYSRGDDYELNRGELTITALGDGLITDGEELLIDYEAKPVGVFEAGDYSGDPREEHVETIPQLTSERGCAQAAKVIVDVGSSPRTEADVSFPPTIPADLSLAEALDLEDVPGDAMAVYELTDASDELRARLGDRARVRDTVQQIQNRLSETVDRV